MTRKNLRVASALTLFLVVAGVAVAQTPRRLALVIGNSGYTREPVPTAGEDALLMKSSLEGIGFEVDYYENVDRQAFLQAIQQFEATLRRGDVALFYFAGHGINVDGNNYLVPLGARIFSDTDATFEAIPLNRVTESFSFSDVSTGLAFVGGVGLTLTGVAKYLLLTSPSERSETETDPIFCHHACRDPSRTNEHPCVPKNLIRAVRFTAR